MVHNRHSEIFLCIFEYYSLHFCVLFFVAEFMFVVLHFCSFLLHRFFSY